MTKNLRNTLQQHHTHDLPHAQWLEFLENTNALVIPTKKTTTSAV